MDYYLGTKTPYALFGTGFHVFFGKVVGAEIEATHVWASQATTSTGSEESPANAADPLWYGTIGLQLQIPFENLRPYGGVAVGRLFTCGTRGHCGTTAIDAGVSVDFGRKIGLTAEWRRRNDSRYPNIRSVASEYRGGAFFKL